MLKFLDKYLVDGHGELPTEGHDLCFDGVEVLHHPKKFVIVHYYAWSFKL